MSGPDGTDDWRLGSIAVRDGESYVVTLVGAGAARREYQWPSDERPPDDLTQDGAPVLLALAAFRRASQRSVCLEAGVNPVPGDSGAPTWRLVVIAARDDASFSVTLSGADGQARGYVFTAELVDVKGVPLLTIGGDGFDRDAGDRASARAVIDVVGSFHKARQHPIRLSAA